MMLALLTVLLVGMVGVTPQVAPGGMRRVCYYTNWAQYRPNGGKFFPEDVDPSLCTHLIYTFARLDGTQLHAFEWNDESTPWSKGMYERFQALKQQNPGVKTLLAVGGWNLGSGPFSHMVASPQSRAAFAQSAVAFLRKWGFDGLDVDWEYPANRGSPPQDRDRFTDLIRELRAKFEQEAAQTGQPRLLLTAAVAAGKDKIDTAYDIPQLNRYLDFISLMTYDLHGSWETHTGHHTALYPRANEQGDDRYLNLDFAANYWVQRGATPSKLNIGLATYGRTFTLSNPSQNGMGAPTRNAGDAGTYTREAGFLSYYEICQMLQQGAQVHQNAEQHVPYMINGDLWVGYDDPHSLAEKVCYVKQHGFGGIMVWALDLDDFTGNLCGQGKYPLMHAINQELNNPSTANCPSPSAQQPQQPVQQTQPPYQYQTTQPPYWYQTTQPPYQYQTTQPPYWYQTTQPPYLPSQAPQGPVNPAFPGVFWNTARPSTQDQGGFNVQTQNPFLAPTRQPQYVPQTLAPSQQTYNPQAVITRQLPYNPTFAVFWNTLTPSPGVPVQTQNPYVQVTTQPPGQNPQGPAIGGQQTTAASPVQQYNPQGFSCMNLPSDFYPNPYACDEYYICANQVSYRVKCAMGLYYNAVSKHCDWPSNTKCVNLHSTQPPAGGLTQPVRQTQPPVRQTQPPYVQTQPPVYTTAPPGTGGAAASANQFCATRPDGAYSVPGDCAQYITCSGHMGTAKTCPAGLAFNQNLLLCQRQNPYVPQVTPTLAPQSAPHLSGNTGSTGAQPAAGTSGNSQQNFCATRGDGAYRDSADCGHYYQCANHVTNYMACPPGLVFNDAVGTCDFAFRVPACFNYQNVVG